jgi:hypothetical protein
VARPSIAVAVLVAAGVLPAAAHADETRIHPHRDFDGREASEPDGGKAVARASARRPAVTVGGRAGAAALQVALR